MLKRVIFLKPQGPASKVRSGGSFGLLPLSDVLPYVSHHESAPALAGF